MSNDDEKKGLNLCGKVLFGTIVCTATLAMAASIVLFFLSFFDYQKKGAESSDWKTLVVYLVFSVLCVFVFTFIFVVLIKCGKRKEQGAQRDLTDEVLGLLKNK